MVESSLKVKLNFGTALDFWIKNVAFWTGREYRENSLTMEFKGWQIIKVPMQLVMKEERRKFCATCVYFLKKQQQNQKSSFFFFVHWRREKNKIKGGQKLRQSS